MGIAPVDQGTFDHGKEPHAEVYVLGLCWKLKDASEQSGQPTEQNKKIPIGMNFGGTPLAVEPLDVPRKAWINRLLLFLSLQTAYSTDLHNTTAASQVFLDCKWGCISGMNRRKRALPLTVPQQGIDVLNS